MLWNQRKKYVYKFLYSKCKYNMCIDNIYGLSFSQPTYVFQKIHDKMYLYYQKNQLYFLTDEKINSKVFP